jgi:C4-dicarboxylate-specific signal transduction histidine kinase
VHRIITNAGGDITVGESEWGGADFKITLPLNSSE